MEFVVMGILLIAGFCLMVIGFHALLFLNDYKEVKKYLKSWKSKGAAYILIAGIIALGSSLIVKSCNLFDEYAERVRVENEHEICDKFQQNPNIMLICNNKLIKPGDYTVQLMKINGYLVCIAIEKSTNQLYIISRECQISEPITTTDEEGGQ